MRDESGVPEFGQWMRQKMQDVGTNQRQLALRLKIRPATVSNWMRGVRRPTVDNCVAIAEALVLDPMEVMRRAGHTMSPISEPRMTRELTTALDQLPPEEQDFILRFVRFYLADRRRVGAQRAERIPDAQSRHALGLEVETPHPQGGSPPRRPRR